MSSHEAPVAHEDQHLVRWLEPQLRQTGIATTLLFFIDNLGSPIVSGVIPYPFTIRFPCKIRGWTLLADVAGSIVLDIWKTDYANYPPTLANSIITRGKPTLSGVIKNRYLGPLNAVTPNPYWDFDIKPGDTFVIHVDSAATVSYVHLALHLHKPPRT